MNKKQEENKQNIKLNQKQLRYTYSQEGYEKKKGPEEEQFVEEEKKEKDKASPNARNTNDNW